MFIVRDHSTAETAFWKGTSKLEKLFDLVLELKELELEVGLIIYVVHVSGRHMIEQGTNGLSHADHLWGIMKRRPMTTYMPLHLPFGPQESPS
jgi:hypothetical protein